MSLLTSQRSFVVGKKANTFTFVSSIFKSNDNGRNKQSNSLETTDIGSDLLRDDKYFINNQETSRIALGDESSPAGAFLNGLGNIIKKIPKPDFGNMPSIELKPAPLLQNKDFCPPGTVALCCFGYNKPSEPTHSPRLLRNRLKPRQNQNQNLRDWTTCVSRKLSFEDESQGFNSHSAPIALSSPISQVTD